MHAKTSLRFVIGSALLFPWLGLATAQAEPFLAEQYKSNRQVSNCQAVEQLADFLVDCQAPAGEKTVGWSWEAGQTEIAPNMAGLVSLALLDAYQATGQLTYLRAAQRYADGLLARPDPSGVYKSDIELMVRLYGVFDDPAYRQAALDMFAAIGQRSADGTAEVARIAAGRTSRPALLGYDVALAIRAALAVDERAYAYQLADALVARSANWLLPNRDPRFSLVSAAAVVSALEVLDEAHYRKTTSRLRAGLARAQQASGAWYQNETQPTAHASLALVYSPLAAERQAATRGLAWLRTSLLKSGSLAAFNDHLPEPFVGQVFSGVNAEALTAFSAACALEQAQR